MGKLGVQVRRFVAVGVSNAVIDLAVFNLLVALNPTRDPFQLVGYNTIAVFLALINSYWWNSRWTFGRSPSPSRWSLGRRRALFAAQGLVNLTVNDVAVAIVAALLEATGLGSSLVANLSKVAGMITASFVSFLAMRLIVFRSRHPHHSAPAAAANERAEPPREVEA